ncbi:MAG: sigma factor, partial [Prevotellaceae bacterium]|nr:sigma factor [Prevotellaceae bacterium]
MESNEMIVSDAFRLYSKAIFSYIHNRINNAAESEDIVQDVFLRLMECDIIYANSVKSLLFT